MEAELKAQYELALAEDRFIEAKENRDQDEEAYQAAKAEFSQLRYEFRVAREEKAAALAEEAEDRESGDAVARPDTLTANATPQES